MIKNFFKIAFRNLSRSKGFSFINIAGLAVGMASALLIFLWIQNELSYDQFHAKKDRIYQAYNRDTFNGELWAWGMTAKPLAPALKSEFPEVEDAARETGAGFLFTYGDKHLKVDGSIVDPGFLTMFSFPLLEGNAANALNSKYNIVITQKLAKKLFGNDDAMGKVLRIDSVDHFTVTGVLKDLPNNTRFDFEYLLPWTIRPCDVYG